MPGALQGTELAEKARDLIEGLKVVFVSGRPQEAAIHGNGMRDTDVLILKPIDAPTLLSEIARALDSA
jgi:two-component SAPR family response regulator